MSIIYINGILASNEDKQLLNYNIIYNDLQFDVEVRNNIQYITTFD